MNTIKHLKMVHGRKEAGMINTFCKGVGCILKSGCLRWMKMPLTSDDNSSVIDKCDEESRELYVAGE